MSEAPSIEAVSAFWEGHPCGSDTASGGDDLEYFRGIERYRYETMPFIPEAASFENFSRKRVLEVGCGVGTDGVQFAEAGADYVGVDLTEAAVALARRNFAVRGLDGEFHVVDAEQLPLADNSFDHVYSFGVIHHTPRPRSMLDEIRRVLRPGGTVTAMVYNRTSVNYYVEIMFLRRLGRTLLRPAWAPGAMAKVLRLSREKLEGHRQNLLRIPHPTRDQWISMNTDGPDCPLARVYSSAEAQELFATFADVRTDVYFFDRSHWPLVGGAVRDSVAEGIGRRLGWHRMIYARKPE
jgi:2-polyprenyl-3-methyl-5-hydroxy-6-metoxy-1,4-benzoquinol methylase